MNKNVIEDLAKGSVEAFNLGINVERDRIIKLIEAFAVVNPSLRGLIGLINGEKA